MKHEAVARPLAPSHVAGTQPAMRPWRDAVLRPPSAGAGRASPKSGSGWQEGRQSGPPSRCREAPASWPMRPTSPGRVPTFKTTAEEAAGKHPSSQGGLELRADIGRNLTHSNNVFNLMK